MNLASKVGVSTKTLRRWDASGKLIAKHTVSNHRYYDETYIRKFFNATKEEDRKTIVYCRVSSAGQKDDLKSQVEAMNFFIIRHSC
jgi:predicted site-specific integrase-resolvase